MSAQDFNHRKQKESLSWTLALAMLMEVKYNIPKAIKIDRFHFRGVIINKTFVALVNKRFVGHSGDQLRI